MDNGWWSDGEEEAECLESAAYKFNTLLHPETTEQLNDEMVRLILTAPACVSLPALSLTYLNSYYHVSAYCHHL